MGISPPSSCRQVLAHCAAIEAELQADVDKGDALSQELQGLRAMLCCKTVRTSSWRRGPLTPEPPHRARMNTEASSHLRRCLPTSRKRLDRLTRRW